MQGGGNCHVDAHEDHERVEVARAPEQGEEHESQESGHHLEQHEEAHHGPGARAHRDVQQHVLADRVVLAEAPGKAHHGDACRKGKRRREGMIRRTCSGHGLKG